MDNSLTHFGVLGMKWGVRRQQKRQARIERKDVEWTKTGKGARVTERARRASTREAEAHALATAGSARTSSGRVSLTFINQYNQKLATLMNEKVGDVPAPSGKVLRYVAKRGEIGVFTALADQEYNINNLKRGLHVSGRRAYSKEIVRKVGG